MRCATFTSLGRRRAGFTLIEVVLALFLLLIGMTSILGMLSFGAAMARTAELRSTAAYSVQAVVADLEESLFPLESDELGNEIAGEPREIVDRPVPGDSRLVYSARATPNPEPEARRSDSGAPLEYRVEIEIAWREGGRKRSRKFETLLLREVPFGVRLRRKFIEGEPAEVQEAPTERPE